MPLPKPKKDEEHDAWIDRCMSNDTMVSEYPDEKQRYAVCQRQWEDKDKKAAEPENIEQRVMTWEDGELRATDGDTPKLTGYAAKYGQWSADLGFFIERIKAGAFDGALKVSDVRCLKNHDPSLLLGRTSSGTLRLESNSVGLRFEVDVPDTTTGRDTVEEVRRGDLAGCSFAFTVAEDEWKNLEDGRAERTITKIDRLFDVGPVTYPAYPNTTVAARSLEQFRASEPPVIKKDKDESPPGAEPAPASAAEVARLRREISIIQDYAKSPDA